MAFSASAPLPALPDPIDADITVTRRDRLSSLLHEYSHVARGDTIVGTHTYSHELDDSGRWLVADGAPEATVWDFAGKGPEGSEPRMLRAHDTITALAWRPGGAAVLATGGTEGTLALWNAASCTPGRPHTRGARWELDDEITAVTWAGPALLLAATRDGTLRCLTPAT